ncbi:DEAD/DEAH box helicase [Ramlibacter alkalitolerans]|uniref:DEAD/DEAH box helicase n=1 Tax=Ramlibacter alkalitolerans TaxID=2039631 RepID=A0ABS1JLX0_9BURK|nr:DEAD/DEAH box helicase [Ramlibacter alkalitolerans]MBL0425212.1 DEAD/DEAH box helicase [Ramlibacter alkalitolerans]
MHPAAPGAPGTEPASPALPTPAFAALGLSAELARACSDVGYVHPTPIQVQAIPPLLRGQDVLGLAPTGSGKTAAFALPLLQRRVAGRQHAFRRVRVLVLVPTRELAQQVGEVFRRLGASFARPLKVAVLYGGVSVNPQMMRLRGGADVVVATPGRLLDLLDRNAVRLDTVEALVLDEADRLLDFGFAAERERVLAALPAERQNVLFSATFAPEVQALADGLLRDAVRIEVAGEARAAPAIEQRVILVDPGRRTELLRHLVQEGGWRRVLVFVATRYATEHVARKLAGRGMHAASLHGEMSQSQRSQVLQDLRDGRCKVLVTTDLAARGIDIPGLDVVVNYDLPRSPDDYVHRIGRTGRAGAQGMAVSFAGAGTQAHFRLIEKRQQMSLPREQVKGFEPVEVAVPPVASEGVGGVKGKRPSKKDKLRAAAART